MQTDVYPTNYSEAVRALRHGPRQQESRNVWLSSRVEKRNTGAPHLQVYGPTAPDTLLRIHVGSGLPFLEIMSGNVQITLHSTWGNSVDVFPAARDTTTVHVGSTLKAHVHGIPAEQITGDTSRLSHSDHLPKYMLDKTA